MADVKIDTNKIIEKLSKRISELTQENAVLTVYVEQVVAELDELTAKKDEKDSPEKAK